MQITLSPAGVATARRWVANYQAWWRAIETVSAINRELLRQRAIAPGGAAGPSARGRPRRRHRRSAS
ncbi:MAG: hypothetical protein HY059_02675 [Proteobacteria bacterium]|nr:hypothetical protein [Pseudomonadota bacterium]